MVLDADCRFLDQDDDTSSVPADIPHPNVFWDGRYADGRLAETGECSVKTEIRWPDGRKDTTYQKIGFIRTGCGG